MNRTGCRLNYLFDKTCCMCHIKGPEDKTVFRQE